MMNEGLENLNSHQQKCLLDATDAQTCFMTLRNPLPTIINYYCYIISNDSLVSFIIHV